MSALTFAGMIALFSLLFLGGSWTLHLQEERGARRILLVMAVISAVTAAGSLVGSYWR